MNKFVYGLIALFVLSLPLYAQCPGGCCPRGYDYYDYYDYNVQPQEQFDYKYVRPEGHLKSIVRVIGVIEPGHTVKGSGTYINYQGLYCVVTASHVICDVQKIYIVFKEAMPNHKTIIGEVLADDPTNDCAIIGLYQHPKNAEDIVGEIAYGIDLQNIKNVKLQNCGFGGDEGLCAGHGHITSYQSPSEGLPESFMVINSRCRIGDSGGPVFLPNHKLCGIVLARNNPEYQATTRVTCARCAYIHAQLKIALSKVSAEAKQMGWRDKLIQPRPIPRQPKSLGPLVPIKPPVLPWRDKIENEIDGIKKAPPKVIIAPKPSPKIQVKPKVEIKPNKEKPKVENKKTDGRYRVNVHVAICTICTLALICLIVGFAAQWKKTYSI